MRSMSPRTLSVEGHEVVKNMMLTAGFSPIAEAWHWTAVSAAHARHQLDVPLLLVTDHASLVNASDTMKLWKSVYRADDRAQCLCTSVGTTYNLRVQGRGVHFLPEITAADSSMCPVHSTHSKAIVTVCKRVLCLSFHGPPHRSTTCG